MASTVDIQAFKRKMRREWQEKGYLFVTPPSLLIRQQKVNKMNYEIRGTSDDVCPSK